ncbi:MFS transporter [Streptomyces sp. NBC_00285]|uniref:MFS transporter n=1 Tax=Streptomyces sp. NBC_00285 TaxID=2975700 RepID=UPI002E289FC8|nr:MFS transporter [Streptomyces sp. NBC_00285]
MEATNAQVRESGPVTALPAGRQAWTTTWLLLAFMLVNFADKAVLGLAGPEIMKEFGLDRQEFGTAQAAFFSLFSLSALGVSFLTRRVRTSVLLLAMGLLWSVAQLPMLWAAAGFGTLIATRVLLGFAEGPAAPVAVHHVHGWFVQRERTLPTAILMVGAAAGVAVAAPALGAVISHFGWRWAFGVAGIAGILWASVWTVKGKEGPLAPPVGRRARIADGGPRCVEVPLRSVFLSGTFITAALGAFGAYWVMSAQLTWLPDYLQTVVGWDLKQASAAVGGGAVANGVVFLAHGMLARRAALRGTGGKLPAGAGLLLMASSVAVAWFATVDALWIKVPMMFGPMALGMVMITVAQTAIARITPPSQRGVVLGALVAVFALGGIASPLILGRTVDSAASIAIGYHNAWLVTATLLLVTGLLAALFLRPERDARRLGVPETPAPRGAASQ